MMINVKDPCPSCVYELLYILPSKKGHNDELLLLDIIM